MVNTKRSIFVVGRDFLLNFPFVAVVRARSIIGQRFGTGEFVVAGWCCDDVAMAGDLAGEAGDWAGDCDRMMLV